MMTMEITGMEAILRNLDLRGRRAVGKGMERGLKKGGQWIQRVSQKQVPVEYGPMKAGAFTRARGSDFNTIVTTGYTADYALRVHEAVGMVLRGQPRPSGLGNYWDPAGRGKAKFLEDPFKTERKPVHNIVKREVVDALRSIKP